MTELLCHRTGIYSQRNRLTKNQTRWIRDFELPLADSVAGIAREPLSTEPGKKFAYSGAGYDAFSTGSSVSLLLSRPNISKTSSVC